jgi:sulfite reductase (NADPH) hemoprotein beta-component
MVTTTAQQAVARVASLASDVVVDALPRSPGRSLFHGSFVTATATNIISIQHGADPGSILLARPDAAVLSLTVTSAKHSLTHLIPYLSELASRPLVLHVAADGNISDALSLRSSLPFVLHSSSVQQAHDHAILASRLARLERKAVLHIFHASHAAEGIVEADPAQIHSFLNAERRHSRTLSAHNGNGHGHGTAHGSNGNGVNGVNGVNDIMSPPSSPKLHLTHPTDDSPLYDLFKAYESASLDTLALVRRALRPLAYSGPSHPSTLIFTLGETAIDSKQIALLDEVGVVQVSLLSPLPPSKILASIPSSVSGIFVLEQIQEWPSKYTPLFLDVVTAVQQRPPSHRPTVHAGTLGTYPVRHSPSALDIQKLLQKPTLEALHLGPSLPEPTPPHTHVEVPSHESAYTKILTTLFGERLQVENAPEKIVQYGAAATRPEFALGRVQVQLDAREELIQAVRDALRPGTTVSLSHELSALLGKWLLARDNVAQSRVFADQIIPLLESSPDLVRLHELQAHFAAPSRWIIGSDVWSHDLGASGLHHLIASSLNVNLLLLDTLPYTQRDASPTARLKKDAGLYAMNRGDVFVASVAVYSSYGQVLQALVEADRYPGPSVVLAYLPYEFPGDSDVGALQVLKETKLAVDAGYWPLYRWDPAKERDGKEPFSLDSEVLKADLEQFLERQNHLSQLVRTTPNVASELVGGLGERLKEVSSSLCCHGIAH